MKQGGRYAKKSAGFTIAETLIVLAVSGGLFLIAALYVGGKQAKTEFQVGVRDIQTQLQQIITQTKSGYYGTQSTSQCSVVDGNPSVSPGSGSLGANGECIFIGKAIVVSETKIYTYPLAGLRQVNGVDTTDPVTAHATIAGDPETFALPNGITLATSSYNGALSLGEARGFAVLSSMANANGSASGSQTFNLYGFSPNFDLNGTADNFKYTIDHEKEAANAYPTVKSVGLCLISGGTSQSALITIGGSSGVAIRNEVKDGTSC